MAEKIVKLNFKLNEASPQGNTYSAQEMMALLDGAMVAGNCPVFNPTGDHGRYMYGVEMAEYLGVLLRYSIANDEVTLVLNIKDEFFNSFDEVTTFVFSGVDDDRNIVPYKLIGICPVPFGFKGEPEKFEE